MRLDLGLVVACVEVFGVVEPNGVVRKFDSSYGTVAELQESHMQPKLTPEEIHLLRQLNERDRQALYRVPLIRTRVPIGANRWT